jgi:hypothetical protein
MEEQGRRGKSLSLMLGKEFIRAEHTQNKKIDTNAANDWWALSYGGGNDVV